MSTGESSGDECVTPSRPTPSGVADELGLGLLEGVDAGGVLMGGHSVDALSH
jgi:hypothetical protein